MLEVLTGDLGYYLHVFLRGSHTCISETEATAFILTNKVQHDQRIEDVGEVNAKKTRERRACEGSRRPSRTSASPQTIHHLPLPWLIICFLPISCCSYLVLCNFSRIAHKKQHGQPNRKELGRYVKEDIDTCLKSS